MLEKKEQKMSDFKENKAVIDLQTLKNLHELVKKECGPERILEKTSPVTYKILKQAERKRNKKIAKQPDLPKIKEENESTKKEKKKISVPPRKDLDLEKLKDQYKAKVSRKVTPTKPRKIGSRQMMVALPKGQRNIFEKKIKKLSHPTNIKIDLVESEIKSIDFENASSITIKSEKNIPIFQVPTRNSKERIKKINFIKKILRKGKLICCSRKNKEKYPQEENKIVAVKIPEEKIVEIKEFKKESKRKEMVQVLHERSEQKKKVRLLETKKEMGYTDEDFRILVEKVRETLRPLSGSDHLAAISSWKGTEPPPVELNQVVCVILEHIQSVKKAHETKIEECSTSKESYLTEKSNISVLPSHNSDITYTVAEVTEAPPLKGIESNKSILEETKEQRDIRSPGIINSVRTALEQSQNLDEIVNQNKTMVRQSLAEYVNGEITMLTGKFGEILESAQNLVSRSNSEDKTAVSLKKEVDSSTLSDQGMSEAERIFRETEPTTTTGSSLLSILSSLKNVANFSKKTSSTGMDSNSQSIMEDFPIKEEEPDPGWNENIKLNENYVMTAMTPIVTIDTEKIDGKLIVKTREDQINKNSNQKTEIQDKNENTQRQTTTNHSQGNDLSAPQKGKGRNQTPPSKGKSDSTTYKKQTRDKTPQRRKSDTIFCPQSSQVEKLPQNKNEKREKVLEHQKNESGKNKKVELNKENKKSRNCLTEDELEIEKNVKQTKEEIKILQQKMQKLLLTEQSNKTKTMEEKVQYKEKEIRKCLQDVLGKEVDLKNVEIIGKDRKKQVMKIEKIQKDIESLVNSTKKVSKKKEQKDNVVDIIENVLKTKYSDRYSKLLAQSPSEVSDYHDAVEHLDEDTKRNKTLIQCFKTETKKTDAKFETIKKKIERKLDKDWKNKSDLGSALQELQLLQKEIRLSGKQNPVKPSTYKKSLNELNKALSKPISKVSQELENKNDALKNIFDGIISIKKDIKKRIQENKYEDAEEMANVLNNLEKYAEKAKSLLKETRSSKNGGYLKQKGNEISRNKNVAIYNCLISPVETIMDDFYKNEGLVQDNGIDDLMDISEAIGYNAQKNKIYYQTYKTLLGENNGSNVCYDKGKIQRKKTNSLDYPSGDANMKTLADTEEAELQTSKKESDAFNLKVLFKEKDNLDLKGNENKIETYKEEHKMKEMVKSLEEKLKKLEVQQTKKVEENVEQGKTIQIEEVVFSLEQKLQRIEDIHNNLIGIEMNYDKVVENNEMQVKVFSSEEKLEDEDFQKHLKTEKSAGDHLKETIANKYSLHSVPSKEIPLSRTIQETKEIPQLTPLCSSTPMEISQKKSWNSLYNSVFKTGDKLAGKLTVALSYFEEQEKRFEFTSATKTEGIRVDTSSFEEKLQKWRHAVRKLESANGEKVASSNLTAE